MTTVTNKMELVVPIGNRVLVRKDDDKKTSKGGIILLDDMEIPVLTGRIVAVSDQVEHNPDCPIRQYDKVLINPTRGIPVAFEGDNKLFIIPVEDVVAIIKQGKCELEHEN